MRLGFLAIPLRVSNPLKPSSSARRDSGRAMSLQPSPVLRDARPGPLPAAGLLRDIWRSTPVRLRRHLSGGTYRPEIDGLRFFAIAIVVVGHLAERLTRFFPGARALAEGTTLGDLVQRPGLGVYLFFAISGFILASQAARAKAHPLSGTFLRTYFGRRILRIEPPYVVLLVATFLFIVATGYSPEGAKQFETAPASLGLSLAGSIVYLHGLVWGTFPRLFPPGWSLEIEVQFYVLAPLFFALWFASARTGVRIALGVVGLAGGSLLSLTAPQSAGPLHLQTSILLYLHFFWLGLVLSQAQGWIAERLATMPPVVPNLLGWGGLALYLVVPNAPAADTGPHLAIGLVMRAAALTGIAAMFAAVFAPCSSFRSLCARPWIALIGGACYSLYLTHLQVIQVTTSVAAKLLPGAGLATLAMLAAVQVIAVLCVGLTFYAVIERTFMRRDWPQAFWRLFVPAAPSGG